MSVMPIYYLEVYDICKDIRQLIAHNIMNVQIIILLIMITFSAYLPIMQRVVSPTYRQLPSFRGRSAHMSRRVPELSITSNSPCIVVMGVCDRIRESEDAACVNVVQ